MPVGSQQKTVRDFFEVLRFFCRMFRTFLINFRLEMFLTGRLNQWKTFRLSGGVGLFTTSAKKFQINFG